MIDCDPGIDDALNLLLAFASSDEVDVAAITVVFGNVGLNNTVRNALALSAPDRVVSARKRPVGLIAGTGR